MTRFPRGTVTFLGARKGIPGPDGQADEIRTAITAHGGVIFHDHGDTLYAAFSAPVPVLRAALQAQRHVLAAARGSDSASSPAMAIHTGRAQERNGSYAGPTFNRLVNILDAAHPGQMVLSASTHDALQNLLTAEIQIQSLGEYRLKYLFRTAQLYQVVAPNLPTEFPPLNTLDGRPHNLPIQDSPLIGREQEVSTCSAVISKPELHLLTLLGSSGMGKTRLALQVAVEVINNFADGVWFVSLAPVTDPNLLISEIAQVLGVREQPGEPLLETLTAFLQTKQLLLVLDNFEQLWSAAPTITELLADAPQVKLMVTSQVALEIESERVFAVPPLSMPSRTDRLSVDEISQIPAVALFIERARDVQPSFTFTAAMAPAVVELCTRLEGLPLAIELVASQSTRYFPGDMLVMLQNRLTVARASRRGNTREDTLRPVLDWIREVLGPGVAGLFARLGIFVGGCTAESARAVCNPTNDLALDVEEALAGLLENHLLLREELKEGHERYTMLDAIHDYAHQRLTRRREIDRLQQAHLNYYTNLAETAEPRLKGPEREIWVSRLDDEHHNLRAALSRSSTQHPEQMLRLSTTLTRFWFIHGHLSEGCLWLESALEKAPMAPAALRANGWQGLGLLAQAQSNYDQAQAFCETALKLREELGDRAGMAALLNNMGIIAMARGQRERAASLYEEGLVLARELGDTHAIGHYLSSLGVLMRYQANFPRAAAYFEEALHLYQQLQDEWESSLALDNLGWVAYFQAEYERAEEYFSQSLVLAQRQADESLQAEIFEGQGRVRLALNDLPAARRLLSTSIRMYQQQETRLELVRALEAFAALRLAEQQPHSAAQLLGATSALREMMGAPAAPVIQRQLDEIKGQALEQISQADYLAAWQAGQTMSLEPLIDELLNSPAPRG